LASAIRDTFSRRCTPIDAELPLAPTPAFGGDAEKQVQWRAFLRTTLGRDICEGRTLALTSSDGKQ
jgi:hypothetical protein